MYRLEEIINTSIKDAKIFRNREDSNIKNWNKNKKIIVGY